MAATIQLGNLEVRVRAMEDRDRLRLEWDGGEDYRNFYREQWEAHLAGTRPVLVADFRGFPIGQVCVDLGDDPPVLVALRVMEPFRGLGIGTALIREAETLCAALGAEVISIGVNPANTGAVRLYERLGYQAVGTPFETEWYLLDRDGKRRRMGEMVQLMMRRF